MAEVESRRVALCFGTFEVDLELRELRKRGTRVKLAGHPFQVLVMLAERAGEVVTREEIRKALWRDEEWGDHEHGLNKAINKVREALSDCAENPRFLITVPRVGYRFVAPVERRVSAASPQPVLVTKVLTDDHLREVSSLTTPSNRPAQQDITLPAPRPKTLSRSRLFAIAVTPAASICIIFLVLRLRGPVQDPFPQAVEPVPLTSYVGSELEPSFSPDGEQVAFIWNGDPESTFHIYSSTLSRTGPLRLTNSTFSDYGPVWSPDRRHIAFVRAVTESEGEVRIVSPDGSGEHKIADISFTSLEHPLAWTRDPHWLVVSAEMPGDGPPALYLMSIETGERRRLTAPPVRSSGDLNPAISPDGHSLAFTRPSTSAWRDVFVMTLSDDLAPTEEPRQVTNLHRIVDTMTWMPNGQELIFSAATALAGARFLFRARVDQPSSAAAETGVEGVYPAVSPDGAWLAYSQKNIEQTSTWRLLSRSSPSTGGPQSERLLSSTRRDFTADLSPDGKRLIFSSARTGRTDIWMSQADGSGLERVTSFGASTPRWSPDGRRAVVESTVDGQSEIYVLDLANKSARRLTFDPGPDVRPSWSRDGKSIYFSSNRTGKFQLWKAPSQGGPAVQVTRFGGVYGVEGLDGKWFYYLTTGQPANIQRVPVGGGDEQELVKNVIGYSAIAVGKAGLYFLSSITARNATLEVYDLAKGARARVQVIDRPVHHFLSSPPDGGSILYTRIDQQESDLMLRPLHVPLVRNTSWTDWAQRR